MKNENQYYRFNNEPLYELMPFKVRDILLISSLYDAYILENERLLSEQIFGEYHQLNLSSAPKITHASGLDQALDILQNKDRKFDLVIVMRRLGDTNVFEIGKRIKRHNNRCFILLLLNNNSEISMLKKKQEMLSEIDNIFVWNGDSKVFLAMIKYVEDKVNAVNDTRVSMTRIILLVEDSVRYYSRFLPILYTQIVKQTQRLIMEENMNDMIKLLRMRARPKILLAKSFEQAAEIISRYEEYLLCVISDIKFSCNGSDDEEAGFKLVSYLRGRNIDVPTLLQSSNIDNKPRAENLRSAFLHKESQHLDRELTDFMLNNLGFGDFVFKDNNGNEIARAKTMDDFKKIIKDVPEESILYHAKRNHFSAWLLARGEVHYAKVLQPVKAGDFNTAEELKHYIMDIFEKTKVEKAKGRIISFDESMLHREGHIIKLADGSLGGKGRGLAFINSLLQKVESDRLLPEWNIKIPLTTIIGTDEFESFMESSRFSPDIYNNMDYRIIQEDFLKADLSEDIQRKIKRFLSYSRQPLAIRSSGLFEDSFSLPFAGIYSTYLLPNNKESLEKRVSKVTDSIKLIYASIFSNSAKTYFDAINYKMQEEKMAIVIQNVIGRNYNGVFYPHISGIAQSYNYYPVSYINVDDGLAVIAVGLGKYVVDGEKAFRFCPRYPKIDILDQKELLKNSQREFYAVDMMNRKADLRKGEDATLRKLEIDHINENFINHCVSIYNHQKDQLEVIYNKKGPRVVNFANILKYNSIPLAKTIETLLGILKHAMGTAVEMEFAVDLDPLPGSDKPTFYILQIKPLLSGQEEISLDTISNDRKDMLVVSQKAMGNGILLDIHDLICADINSFDRTKTLEMADELQSINRYFQKEDKKYILIGPGRWGSRDRWLGIPVSWASISNAKVIVEVNLRDFQVDTSLGSHFFCNIISMNVGYISVPYNKPPSHFDHSYLQGIKPLAKYRYFSHYRFESPLKVILDSRKGSAVIYK